jgi:hypothetical protein
MNYLAYTKALHDRLAQQLRTSYPDIDEKTLADTLEGLTDLQEILSAIVRSALTDEAMALGLRGRIKEMQQRAERLEDRAVLNKSTARDVMAETGVRKITAPDFTVSLRDGSPNVVVTEETAIPATYFKPQPAKLDRVALLSALKAGLQVPGAELSNGQPVLSVRVG